MLGFQIWGRRDASGAHGMNERPLQRQVNDPHSRIMGAFISICSRSPWHTIVLVMTVGERFTLPDSDNIGKIKRVLECSDVYIQHKRAIVRAAVQAGSVELASKKIGFQTDEGFLANLPVTRCTMVSKQGLMITSSPGHLVRDLACIEMCFGAPRVQTCDWVGASPEPF